MSAYAAYDRAEYIRDTKELKQIARDEWVRDRADEIKETIPGFIGQFASPFQNPVYRRLITSSKAQELYEEFEDRLAVLFAEEDAEENEFIHDDYRGVA